MATTGGGWNYDDPNAPAKIMTGPDTRTATQAAIDAKAEVLVGCKTEPAIVG